MELGDQGLPLQMPRTWLVPVSFVQVGLSCCRFSNLCMANF